MHPKKETARISVLPDPPASPVNMAKTQPLIDTPDTEARIAPITVTSLPKPAGVIESIPPLYLWILLGISALLFLIQLWNYFSI